MAAKLRLWGTPQEVEESAAAVRSAFTILEEPPDYPDRQGALVRRYFTVLPLGYKLANTATGEVMEVEGKIRRRRPRCEG